ncbi:hypothetical protein ACFQ9J_02575 [Streptomyces sp. NPDC056529]|uniref:hypothetical protein n=1 Tax=Streptomyces sp. NPDC056529 TaxID=3345855 RepID=UPI00368834E4
MRGEHGENRGGKHRGKPLRLYTLTAGAPAVALAAALSVTLTTRPAWAATVVDQAES